MREILITCVCTIAIIFLGSAAWIAWRPISIARSDLKTARLLSKNVEEPLSFIFRQSQSPRSYVINHYTEGSSQQTASQMDYTLRISLSDLAFRLFFSDHDILILYAQVMPFGNGNGISFGAAKFFEKSIEDLTPREVIFLEVVSRSPSKLNTTNGKEEIEKIIDELVDVYERGTIK